MSFLLYTLPSAFIVDVDSPNLPPTYLHIDRLTSAFSLLPRSTTPLPSTPPEHIGGLLGSITFLSTPYLVVITSSSQVATLLSTPIRQITATRLLPFAPKPKPLHPAELERDEQLYLSLFREQLAAASYYFSYDLDLTLTIQRLSAIRRDDALARLHPHQRADERFYWNRYLSRQLIDAGADAFVLPVINGYIFHQSLHLSNSSVSFLLISRRSTQRSGRRFITRGLDIHGYASNFAETEQILVVTNPTDRNVVTVASFLQTRGSIPLLWSQPVSLKYTPKIRIGDQGKENELAFRRHFEVQVERYGRNVCVNLVNQKGSELVLVKEFTALVNTYNAGRKSDAKVADDGTGGVSGTSIDSGEVRLINWDFHKECSKMKFENVSKLIALIGQAEWSHQGHFQATVVTETVNGVRKQQWTPTRLQQGVFRTNCIDCLDRTNVVQAAFAQHVLVQQLAALLPASITNSTVPPSVQQMLRVCWANNADAMSVQYSGTGALKTDFTRTGKRTIKGAMKDGVNSLTRYYLNNFRDGRNQDRVDLFLGLYQPSASHSSPFAPRRSRRHPLYQRSVPEFFVSFALALLIVLGLWSYLVPSQHWVVRPWQHVSTWVSAMGFSVLVGVAGSRVLLRYGDRYVNKPVLREGRG